MRQSKADIIEAIDALAKRHPLGRLQGSLVKSCMELGVVQDYLADTTISKMGMMRRKHFIQLTIIKAVHSSRINAPRKFEPKKG